MKTVYSNHKEVAHVWAGGNRSTGRASRMFFDGPTIFSYGRHFAIAKIYSLETGDRVAIFNSARYSLSTGKHQSLIRSAWSGNGESVTLPVNDWPSNSVLTVDQWHELQALADVRATESDEARKNAKREQARAARERAKQKKAAEMLALASFPERLAKWRETGEDLSWHLPGRIASMQNAFLRIVGADVVTSKEARVSVRSARALLAMRARGPVSHGETIGVYNVTRDQQGIGITIGCHFIPESEIKWLEGALEALTPID